MADIPDIQSNLSTGQMQLPPNDPVVPPGAYAQPSRPVDLINYQRRLDTTLPSLQFPADTPKYYMAFDIMSYRRADLFSVGQTQTISFITLPLPLKMVDTHQVDYEQKPVGPLLGAAINNSGIIPGVQSAVERMRTNGSGNGFMGGAAAAGQAAVDIGKTVAGAKFSDAGAGAIAGGVVNMTNAAEGVGTAIRAATGYSGNYFLTVLLQGPKYKTHNFAWQFSARTPAEAESLNRIFRVMNNSMAPGLAFSNAIFSFPRVFRIAYHPNSQYLYKFKPAVLVGFTVDTTGGGVPSFYREDGTTSGLGAPVMYSVQAQFLELEFWLRSDFGGDDEGAGGDNNPYGTTGSTRDGN